MTSTLDPLQLGECDDPATVLAYARAHKAAEDDEAREVLKAAARWAAMHSGESLVGPVEAWHESALPLGGEGCPEVAEFAVVEFAAALGRSTESGRRYLSHAVEGFYRLRRCWARLEAGELPAWRLGFIAERTVCLSPAAAAFVDTHVAAVAHQIGPAQLDRLINEAKARFDPDQTEADRLAAAEAGHFDIGLRDVGRGRVRVEGDLDLADALDLEAAVAVDAHQQLLLGSTESLDVRRSIAVGNLARAQHPLDLGTDPQRRAAPASQASGGAARPPRARRRPRRRRAGPTPGGRWPGSPPSRSATGAPTPTTQVTVQPVLDLADHLHVGSYEASARLKLQTQLRDRTCVFPFCFRPAEQCDCDHRVPHDPRTDRDDGGPTCTCNLAPCCRRHHRAKTTGGWTYVTVEPGVYLWRSPLGYQFLRDHTGTLDVTPDPERRRLAHEFRRHFGEP